MFLRSAQRSSRFPGVGEALVRCYTRPSARLLLVLLMYESRSPRSIRDKVDGQPHEDSSLFTFRNLP